MRLSSLSFALALIFVVKTGTATASESPYAPTFVHCPSYLKIRPASKGLSAEESAWRDLRLGNVIQSLKSYLPRANIKGFDLDQYLGAVNISNVPIVGLAVSGGGTQSGLGGLGLWQAFDERYAPAKAAGTGGLAQCLTYLTGLSGGGFLSVSSLASSNFSTIEELRRNVNFATDYLVGPDGNATSYFETLFERTAEKFAKGFPISVADIFGMFFRQYLPKSWLYKDFSDVAHQQNHSFALGLGPMPVMAMAEVVPGSSPLADNIMYPGLNSSKLTSYEITPFEFGSWIGGRVQAFMPTQYLGTTMRKGNYQNGKKCVKGFDKFTFVQGSTADEWNGYLLEAFFNDTIHINAKRDKIEPRLAERKAPSTKIVIPPGQEDNPQVVLSQEVSEAFNITFNQTLWATYPNPFLDYNPKMTGIDQLLLVDGSETGETIPLRPLIQPARKVDFIVAFDASTDGAYEWVNGTNLQDTSAVAADLGLPFPIIPDATTMINLEIVKYPTFFGCYAPANDVPLVLYVPNSPWSAYTNYSYTQSSFTDKQLDLVFGNDFNIATFGNGTIDKEWPACLACAMIKKSVERVGMHLPEICNACFNRHCWNGTRAETPRHPAFDPRLIMDPGLDYETWNATVWS